MEPSKKQCHEHFFGATNLNSFSALFVCILLWSLFLISTMTPSRLPCSAPKQHLQQVESAMRGQNSLKVSSSSSGRQADRAISVSLSVSIDTIRYNHIIIPTWWHPLTPAVSDLLRPVRSLECALALGVTYGVLLGSLYSLLPTLSSSLLPAPLCLLSYSNFVFLWLFHSILLPLAFNQFLQHNAYSSFLQ